MQKSFQSDIAFGFCNIYWEGANNYDLEVPKHSRVNGFWFISCGSEICYGSQQGIKLKMEDCGI